MSCETILDWRFRDFEKMVTDVLETKETTRGIYRSLRRIEELLEEIRDEQRNRPHASQG